MNWDRTQAESIDLVTGKNRIKFTLPARELLSPLRYRFNVLQKVQDLLLNAVYVFGSGESATYEGAAAKLEGMIMEADSATRNILSHCLTIAEFAEDKKLARDLLGMLKEDQLKPLFLEFFEKATADFIPVPPKPPAPPPPAEKPAIAQPTEPPKPADPPKKQ